MTKIITIQPSDDAIRLDRWFKRHYPGVSHGVLQKALRKGDIRLGGKKAESATRVQAGQELRIWKGVPLEAHEKATTKQRTSPPLSPEQKTETKRWVVYEDARCLILNKPAGLAVQGGSKITDCVDDRLPALASKGNTPKLVHRLDKDTSGALLLARTASDATFFTKAFAAKEIEKTYWALIKGVPELRRGTIDLPLAKRRVSGEEKMIPVDAEEEDAKPAVTHYEVIEALAQSLSWVALIPVTGRTHQLRAHLHAIDHPIIGDGKYGGREAFIEGMELSKQLHLHARQLEMEGDKPLNVNVPLPKHMKESWKLLGITDPG